GVRGRPRGGGGGARGGPGGVDGRGVDGPRGGPIALDGEGRAGQSYRQQLGHPRPPEPPAGCPVPVLGPGPRAGEPARAAPRRGGDRTPEEPDTRVTPAAGLP